VWARDGSGPQACSLEVDDEQLWLRHEPDQEVVRREVVLLEPRIVDSTGECTEGARQGAPARLGQRAVALESREIDDLDEARHEQVARLELPADSLTPGDRERNRKAPPSDLVCDPLLAAGLRPAQPPPPAVGVRVAVHLEEMLASPFELDRVELLASAALLVLETARFDVAYQTCEQRAEALLLGSVETPAHPFKLDRDFGHSGAPERNQVELEACAVLGLELEVELAAGRKVRHPPPGVTSAPDLLEAHLSAAEVDDALGLRVFARADA
jgi:hypothetical protein